MASFAEHREDCERELGEGFSEVHYWLDEFWPICGPDHRDIRHHDLGIEKVRSMWGDRAARAAEIHIIKDCRGGIPQSSAPDFVLRLAMKPKIEEAFRKEGY